MLPLLVVLGALPLAPQVDGGLSTLTVQELLAVNAQATNPCYGGGAHERVSVNWVVPADGGTPAECTLDAPDPLGECLRRAVCDFPFPPSAAPTTVRATWEGPTPPLRPPLRAADPSVEAAIEAQAPSLAGCAAQVGRLEAQLIIGSEGHVLGATFPFRSDTLSAQSEACVLGAVSAWKLPSPRPVPSSVEAGLLFAPSPEEFGLLGGARGHRVTTRPPGGLSREVIYRVIMTSMPTFKACYEVRARRDPTLTGRVDVRFIIGPTGSVDDARVEKSTLPSEDALTCLLKTVRALQFPRPEGGGTVTVNFPWVFVVQAAP